MGQDMYLNAQQYMNQLYPQYDSNGSRMFLVSKALLTWSGTTRVA